jgi:AraC family transcriptional regulator
MTNQNRTEQRTILELEPPRFENGKPMLITGLRGHFTTATMAGIPAQWKRFVSYGAIPGQVGRVHYGLCFCTSEGIDYLCGVEVSSLAGLPAEFSHANIPAQKYAVFAHYEHVSKLRDTMDAISRHWLAGSGHEIAPPVGGAPDSFERYGEKFDPVAGKGDVEVWIPVKS